MPAMIIGGGLSLLGGLMGSSSAKRAAREQAQAQMEAARIQQEAINKQINAQVTGTQAGLDVMSGQRMAGETALAALMSGLGLGPYQAQGTQQVGGGFLDKQGNAYTGETFTNDKGQTVDAQGNVLQTAPGFTIRGITQEQADAAASPYAGTFLEKFTYNDLTADPSYQFRLNEGRRNLEASLAARGNRLGSQSLKDITNYGQEAASQEYQSAFQRFQTEKQRQLQQLQAALGFTGATGQAAGSLQGAGQQIGQGYAQQGQVMGQGVSNAGNAMAGGIVGSTNALVGGLKGIGQSYLAGQTMNNQMDLFNQYMNRPSGGMTTTVPTGSNWDLLSGGLPKLGGTGP